MHEMTMRNSYIDRAGAGAGPAGGLLPRLGGSPHDRELLLLDGESIADLRGQVAYLAEMSGQVAPAGLGVLAAVLQRGLAGRPVRAAVVAAGPEQASHRFARLLELLDRGERAVVDVPGGVFLGGGGAGRGIGFLFPGQGSGRGDDGGALAARFETVRELYRTVTLPAGGDPAATAVAQPRITLSSAAGLRVLALLGIEASAAVGHSLGELTALCWAGAMTEAELVALAGVRGQVMAEASAGGGAMAGIGAGPGEVEPLLAGEPVVIAGYNGPGQTVISGPAGAVERVRGAAAARGWRAARVRVSHAFHSPAVAPAAARLGAHLAARQFRPLARRVISTLTGEVLPADADLRQLLVRQVREPVRFSQALTRMAPGTDLLIEVGPGRVLSGLAARITPGTPVIPLSTDGPSLAGVLSAAAAAYVLGTPVRHDQLFADRSGTT
jgi:enediyne polyketide synthase